VKEGNIAVNVSSGRRRPKVLNAPDVVVKETRPWLVTEQQQKLFSSYPLFFRSARYPAAYPSNLALFGIQSGLGWYPIIEAAALEIERELHTTWCAQARTPNNIASIDYELRAEASLDVYVYPVMSFCSGIREASGQLHISMVQGYLCGPEPWHRIRESIKKAEARARTACERCGEPGRFREMYWEHVYCDDCVAPKPTANSFEVDNA
jgi:hypothetical protein